MAEIESFSPPAMVPSTLDTSALIPQAVQSAPGATVIAESFSRPTPTPTIPSSPFTTLSSGEIEHFLSSPTVRFITAPGEILPSITEPPLSVLATAVISSVTNGSLNSTTGAHHRPGNSTESTHKKSKDHHNEWPAWKIAIIAIFGFASLPVSIGIIYALRMARKGRKDFHHDEEWSSSFWKRHKRGPSEGPPTRSANPITAAKNLTNGKLHRSPEEKAQHRAEKAARRASRAEIRKQRSDRQWGQLAPIKTDAAGENSPSAQSQSSKKSWGTPTSPHPGVKQMIVETELGRAWGRPRRFEDEDDKILVVPVPTLKPVKIPATTLTRASRQSPTLMTPKERRRSLAAAATATGPKKEKEPTKRPKVIGMATALRLDSEALRRDSGNTTPTSPTSPVSPGDTRHLSFSPSPAPRTPKSARFDIDDGMFDDVPLEEHMTRALNARSTSVAFTSNANKSTSNPASAPAPTRAAPAAIDLPLTRISTTQNWTPEPSPTANTNTSTSASASASAARRLSRAFARFSLTGPVDPQTALAEAAAKRASAASSRASKRVSRGNRRYSAEEVDGVFAIGEDDGDGDGDGDADAEAKVAARRDAEERLAGSGIGSSTSNSTSISRKEDKDKRPAPSPTPTNSEAALAHSRRASKEKTSEAAAAVHDAEMAEQRILQTVRRSVEGQPERGSFCCAGGVSEESFGFG